MVNGGRPTARRGDSNLNNSQLGRLEGKVVDTILKCLLDEQDPIDASTVLDSTCPSLLKIQNLTTAYPILQQRAMSIFYASNAFEFNVVHPSTHLLPTLRKIQRFKSNILALEDSLSNNEDKDVRLHCSIKIIWENTYWDMTATEVETLMRLQCDMPWDIELVIKTEGNADIEVDCYELPENLGDVAKGLGHRATVGTVQRGNGGSRGNKGKQSLGYDRDERRYRNFADLALIARAKLGIIREEMRIAADKEVLSEGEVAKVGRARKRVKREDYGSEDGGVSLNPAPTPLGKAEEDVTTDESEEDKPAKKKAAVTRIRNGRKSVVYKGPRTTIRKSRSR